jgi:hypothetical protein
MAEKKQRSKRPPNCNRRDASDVPAASEDWTAKNRRYQARATAKEAALKRDKPAGKICSRYGGKIRRPQNSGRPVACAALAKRRSDWSGVLCVWRNFCCQSTACAPLQPFWAKCAAVEESASYTLVSVVGRGEYRRFALQDATKVHLPAGTLHCSIGVAYQAADAGHPNWGRASSPPSRKTPASSIHS